MIALPSRGTSREAELRNFANELIKIQDGIDFKVSARGWCYLLEQFGLINKAQFGVVEGLINHNCRATGYLPIDFVAEEDARKFSGVEEAEGMTPEAFVTRFLKVALNAEDYYTPNWWDGEEYYIQMLVEKIDLKSLFRPVCEEYHIPIATSKGWSSMLQRAEYARRFKQAEDLGLRCVLLYCGDHDPDGLRISTFLEKNLVDIEDVVWTDGTEGYSPDDLIVERFGLNLDFIQANKLSWIDNLITGSKKKCPVCGKPQNLADPHHPNHYMTYVQNYLRDIGARKCEANALVVIPEQARELCRQTIEKYVGQDARNRFQARWEVIADKMRAFREDTGIREVIEKVINDSH